jgi:glycine betaine/proline transport system substrate-binding protein
MKFTSTILALGLLALGFTFATPSPAQAASCADKPTIKVGWVAWAENKFEAKLLKKVLEDRLDCKVKLSLMQIGVEYKSVAEGNMDVMLEAWYPDTHKAYRQKLGLQVWSMGPLFTGAVNGWAVPDYIPKSKLNSMADLKKPEVAEKLDHTIQGIDPGAGLMQLSHKALKAYGLDKGDAKYRIMNASGPAMTAALARAEKRHDWIVVTLWTPHWAFGRWDLRMLKDPKGSLGAAQHSDKLVRTGFYQEYPKASGMVSRMQIPLDTLQKYMYQGEDTSYDQAVQQFMDDNPKVIDYWVKGMPALAGSD